MTSSPHYPQSNGFIERQIQTVKATMKKVAMTKSDLQMGLLVLRATPVDSHLPSPAEMLNARKFKTNVPVKIRNEHWRKEDIGQRLTDRQISQRINYDRRGATDLALVTNSRTGCSRARYDNRSLAACKGCVTVSRAAIIQRAVSKWQHVETKPSPHSRDVRKPSRLASTR